MVMPVVAPIMKISQCKQMKANVIINGETIAEVKKIDIYVIN